MLLGLRRRHPGHSLRSGQAGKLTEAARLAASGAFQPEEEPPDEHADLEDSADARMRRILAQAGVLAVDDAGGDATHLAVRRPAAEEFWLWPCNLRVWSLWSSLQTQWRHAGMVGLATGLDHAAVEAVLRQSRLRPRMRAEAQGHIQAMELAALSAWAERASRESASR